MFTFFHQALQSPQERARLKKMREDAIERRCAIAVPWNPNMKWARELNIKAETYQVLELFESVPSARREDPNEIPSKKTVLSPEGNWMYCVKQCLRGETLTTMCGSKRGTVMFDGPVRIPCLFTRTPNGSRWNDAPFMSLTPLEFLTLRGGTRLAKGRVVIAGLGLGHQLIEVSKRPQVKELILVEKSQELVDFILPKIEPHLAKKLDQVIVGNAYEELPKLRANVALVDIFENYGGNSYEQRRLRESCLGIEHIWCWGTAAVGDESPW